MKTRFSLFTSLKNSTALPDLGFLAVETHRIVCWNTFLTFVWSLYRLKFLWIFPIKVSLKIWYLYWVLLKKLRQNTKQFEFNFIDRILKFAVSYFTSFEIWNQHKFGSYKIRKHNTKSIWNLCSCIYREFISRDTMITLVSYYHALLFSATSFDKDNQIIHQIGWLFDNNNLLWNYWIYNTIFFILKFGILINKFCADLTPEYGTYV